MSTTSLIDSVDMALASVGKELTTTHGLPNEPPVGEIATGRDDANKEHVMPNSEPLPSTVPRILVEGQPPTQSNPPGEKPATHEPPDNDVPNFASTQPRSHETG